MKSIHTYYDNLKVARTAPPEVIRAAYKSLAQIYHPDKNQGDVEAARIMKLINAAYEVLSDPMKRAEHDRWIAQQEAILKNQQDQKTDHVYKQSSQNQQNTEKVSSGPIIIRIIAMDITHPMLIKIII